MKRYSPIIAALVFFVLAAGGRLFAPTPRTAPDTRITSIRAQLADLKRTVTNSHALAAKSDAVASALWTKAEIASLTPPKGWTFAPASDDQPNANGIHEPQYVLSHPDISLSGNSYTTFLTFLRRFEQKPSTHIDDVQLDLSTDGTAFTVASIKATLPYKN